MKVGTRGHLPKREHLVLAAIVLAGVGIPLVAALTSGAINIPHNDDWVFYRIAAELVESGELELLNWNEMTLVGHLLWGLPFLTLLGNSVAAAHWAGVSAAAIALVAAHTVYRRFLSPGVARFGVATLAAVPIFSLLSTTYMTDITALAAQLACLALGLAALDAKPAGRTPLLVASLLVGLLGFATREVALAAPLAVIAGHAVAARQEKVAPRAVLWCAGIVLLASAAFYLWRSELTDGGSAVVRLWVNPQEGVQATFQKGIGLYFTLALMLVPALGLTGRKVVAAVRQHPLCWIPAIAVLAIGVRRLAYGHGIGGKNLVAGNYILPPSFGDGYQLGAAPKILPDVAWLPLMVVCVIAGALLAGFLTWRALQLWADLRRGRLPSLSPQAFTLATFGLLAAMCVLARAALGGGVYDRYLLPLIPAMLLLVLASSNLDSGLPISRWGGGVALGLSVLVSLLLVTGTNSFGVVRWEAGTRLVAAGISAQDVDAGYEWVGLHSPDRAGAAERPRWREPAGAYMDLFNSSSNCALVSTVPRKEDWVEFIGTEDRLSFLGLHDQRLWLYMNQRACAGRR